MIKHIKSHNKENILFDAHRLSSQKKYVRSDLNATLTKKQKIEKYRSSLLSLKIQENGLPIILVKKKQQARKTTFSQARVKTEVTQKSGLIFGSINDLLKLKQAKSVESQLSKLQGFCNKNKILRKDLVSLENVMFKYSLKNIETNENEAKLFKMLQKNHASLLQNKRIYDFYEINFKSLFQEELTSSKDQLQKLDYGFVILNLLQKSFIFLQCIKPSQSQPVSFFTNHLESKLIINQSQYLF